MEEEAEVTITTAILEEEEVDSMGEILQIKMNTRHKNLISVKGDHLEEEDPIQIEVDIMEEVEAIRPLLESVLIATNRATNLSNVQ